MLTYVSDHNFKVYYLKKINQTYTVLLTLVIFFIVTIGDLSQSWQVKGQGQAVEREE